MLLTYSRSLAGYAHGYLIRQAAAIEATQVLVPRVGQINRFAEEFPNIRWRRLRRSGLAAACSRALGRRVGIRFRLSPWEDYWLRREIAPARLIYTMFLWNGADIAAIMGRRGSPPKLVVHAAGSDVLRATQLALMGREGAALRDAEMCIENADVITCGSEFLRQKMVTVLNAPPQMLRLHYIGVQCGVACRRHSDESSLVLLAVSRLVPVKGVEYTIRAAVRVASELSIPVELRIAGSGPEAARLRSLAEALGGRAIITFLGQLSPKQVRSEMLAADVFVQHNVTGPKGEEEGLGGSLLEAASVGLPVVGTRSGGVCEAVIDGRTGYLVEPGSVSAMARAILRLGRSWQIRKRLGEEGRRHVMRHHNASTQDGKLATYLQTLANRSL